MRKTIEVTALGPAGQQLQRWLEEQFEITGAEPLASELCLTADRLAGIRRELAKPGLDIMDQSHLIASEVKVQAIFARLWRLAGLADKEAPVPWPNPGRPSESDRMERKNR